MKKHEYEIISILLIEVRNNEKWSKEVIPAIEAISLKIMAIKGDNEDRVWDLIVLIEKMIRDTLDISTIKDSNDILIKQASDKIYQENMWKAMLRQAANTLVGGDTHG